MSTRLLKLLLVVVLFVLAPQLVGCNGGETPPVTQSDRVTVSIAVQDDPAHRMAVYALEQRLVSSESIDVVVNYLSPSALADAARSKQYDVVETSPLEVLGAAANDARLAVLSSGVQDLDGAVLVARPDSGLRSIEDLPGTRVGIVSQADVSTLMLRLAVPRIGGDTAERNEELQLQEAPVDSLKTLLDAGDLDGAVLTEQAAYNQPRDAGTRVVSRIAAETRQRLGTPILESVLVTYADVAGQKPEALRELNRLFAQSVTYFHANEDLVLRAVSIAERVDIAYLRWWWEHYDLPLGDLSEETQERLLTVWEAARSLGDTDSYPAIGEVVFNPEGATPAAD